MIALGLRREMRRLGRQRIVGGPGCGSEQAFAGKHRRQTQSPKPPPILHSACRRFIDGCGEKNMIAAPQVWRGSHSIPRRNERHSILTDIAA